MYEVLGGLRREEEVDVDVEVEEMQMVSTKFLYAEKRDPGGNLKASLS